MLTGPAPRAGPEKRLAIVHDIQRYLADKAYYVYLPTWPQYITHAPRVKGFKHHDGFSTRPAAHVHLARASRRGRAAAR